ncbi:Serine/threonine transporter SstT [BD1-7 clade bacterium]|uniref:Serine/threonine transporter SstT n=1 Tax=BD1-7 clade bacterium TaxID=2029982 RepID=A0A5S9NUS5_9GAMM|nr:Serine/threonine transporter SstT [BD1-7 clade bacterium]CAA0094373.1 Serine/threonine transporter SstT [BD1-7 clade bacterium]
MKLILRLIAGIVAGILIGYLAPEFISRAFITFRAVFGQFISYTIPLIILFFIMSGIASLRSGAGRALGVTVAASYGSTVCAGLLAFVIADVVVPHMLSSAGALVSESPGLEPFGFADKLTIPPAMDIMTALVTAFLFGIGISTLKLDALKGIVDQGKDVVELALTRILIPFLPLYICGVFVALTVDGTVFATLRTFGLVLAMALCLHWLWLIILYTVAGLITGRNPVVMLKNMLPAYFTAVGTMSSAATIPVTLERTKSNGVDEHIADFSIPLCATIHMSGSVVTITTCATAVVFLTGGAVPDFSTMVTFVALLGVTLIASPGAPGGSIMASLGLLSSVLGFGEPLIALMIALYIAQDSFGTACNVTGDGAIASVVEKMALPKKAGDH